jgi:hypothetical protein
MKKIMIVKADGQIVPFDEKKFKRSVERSGVDSKTVTEVMSAVVKKLRQKMKTGEIYAIVKEELRLRKPWAAARYDLRNAIVKLGPAGFNFEKYVASVLSAYGYKTETPEEYQGACIKHEIDVTAEKDGRTSFIEAKFRHNFHATVNIKDTLATWARFLDLVDGSKVDLCPHFDEAWIVTNARFTEQSLQFGHCKNMMMIGWNHPKERSFSHMVDVDALFPITSIPDLSVAELKAFAGADIMLCKEVVDKDMGNVATLTGIQPKRLEDISVICEKIVNGE